MTFALFDEDVTLSHVFFIRWSNSTIAAHKSKLSGWWRNEKNLFFSFDLCTFQMHSVTEGARPFNWLLGWLAGALHLSLISGTRQANGFLFHVNYLQCVQKLTIVSSRLILQLTDHMFTQIHFGTVWKTLWKSTPENEIFFVGHVETFCILLGLSFCGPFCGRFYEHLLSPRLGLDLIKRSFHSVRNFCFWAAEKSPTAGR